MEPELYRVPPKQPADLAWVFDRCAFLMNLTSGNKSFGQKRSHNLRQLQTWLRRWSSGEILRGITLLGVEAYTLPDIDHVIAISVIGGADSGNVYEQGWLNDLTGKYPQLATKVSIALTITDEVLRYMVRYKFSARDFLSFVAKMREEERPLTDGECRAIIDSWVSRTTQYVRTHFNLLGYDNEDLNKHYVNTRTLFVEACGSDKYKKIGLIFADLRFIDLVWFSVAEPVLRGKLAPRGTFGVTALEAEWVSDQYRLVCSVCDLIGNFPVDRIDPISAPYTIRLISFHDAGLDCPMHMWNVPKTFPGLSMTRRQVVALAGKV